METITNAVSSVASTATKLVYGDQTKTENNETGGKEPISGEQGSGTATDPFDKGNAATPLDTTANKSTFLDYQTTGNDAKATDEEFLKLNPVLDGPQNDAKTESSGDPKIYTNRQDETYTGMPIVPLDPNVASSGPGTVSDAATGSTGVTDKLWKDTPLDDISRSGAPGAGPSAPDHVTAAAPTSSTGSGPDSAIKTSAPDSVTAASSAYAGTGATDKTSATHGVDATQSSKTATGQDGVAAPPNRDTPDWATTDVPAGAASSNTTKPSTDASGLASDKSGRKSESGKSPALGTSTSHEEKGGKMSHLKEKLKDKLHIGHKDK